jgi:hypothetical protein
MKFLYYGEIEEPGGGTKRELIQLTADFSQIFNGVYDANNAWESFSSFQNYICKNIKATFDLFENNGIRFLRETKITSKNFLQYDIFINYDFKLRNENLSSKSLEQSHRTTDCQKLDSKNYRTINLENVGTTCYMKNDISLLSNNVLVRELIDGGDVHHIFPKEYLKANGFEKSAYNQEANYAFLDTQVNKSIGKKAPYEYFEEARKQCETGEITIVSITNYSQLLENLKTNCVPDDVFGMDYSNYEDFLAERRAMMARKIRDYYYSL